MRLLMTPAAERRQRRRRQDQATATFVLGAAPTHTFYVTADLSLNGTVVDTETSGTVDAACAFQL